MTLNSIYFLFFITGILLVMSIIKLIGQNRSPLFQKLFLLIISYVFIGLSNYVYVAIILLSTVFVYIMGRAVSKTKNKGMLIFSICVLVAELGYFKYTNFFLETVNYLLKSDLVLLKIILPLGISFYIFTAVGYIVDVYNGKYDAEKSFINVALMIAFFPKIISGPIVRGNDFLPQLNNYNGFSWNDVKEGLQIYFLGLFKKIVLADYLGIFVNDVFFAPNAYNTFTVIFAVISYSLQIYFDFAGYSDMAIGVSKMLGINIDVNFRLPYISKNPSEFWQRWHISLSSWLRDYIYFPLGGSRNGNVKTYVNLIAVMLISGIWHGAGWTFIAWGFLHGVYNCLYKLVDSMTGKKLSHSKCRVVNGIQIVFNFIIISILWVLFRAESFGKAISVIKACFTIHGGICQPYTWSIFAIIILLAATYVSHLTKQRKTKLVLDAYPCLDLNKLHNQIALLTFIGFTVIIGYYGNTAFIYGAF